MKSQKTNAFQLAVAGGVLALVLVCATFAWFSSGDHSWVSKIAATIATPSVPSQLNSIEYREGESWKNYGGDVLEVVPGQEWQFRINFTAKKGEVLEVIMSGLSASLREKEEEESVSSSQDDSTAESTTKETTTVVTEANMLSEVLEIKINDGEYNPLVPSDGHIVLRENVGDPDDEFNHHTYTYTIRMKPEAKNLYMDKVISFLMDVTVSGKSVTEETSSQSA